MVNRRVGNLRKENSGRRSSGFTYRPPKSGFVKQQANRKFSRFDSIFKSAYDNYRPKEGENSFRILPATWDGHDDYAYTIYMHRYVGQDTSNYLCLRKMQNKRCPICVEAERSRKAGEEEEARQLSAVEGKVAWILNRDERGKPKPQPYQIPVTLYKDINALCCDNRTGAEIFVDQPDEGYDVRVRRTGAQLNTRYLPTIERDPSPVSDSPKEQTKILDFINEHPIPDILEFKSAEYLEKVMSGTGEDKDEDLDEDEEDEDEERRPSSKRKKLKKGSRDRDEEEEEDVDDEEVDEDEESAPRRARAKRKAEEDEDDQEPEDEEEEEEEEEDEDDTRSVREAKKRKKVRRSSDEDDEEEDDLPRRKLSTRRKPVDEENEEEDDEDGAAYGDDDEEPRPKKRKKLVKKASRRDEDEDEEEEDVEDEDEDEEEAPPRRGKKSQRSSVRRR